MAVTITDQAEAPGKAGKSIARIGGATAGLVRVYQVDFDTSYPTGGENISEIWNDFSSVLGIFVQPADTTVADNRMFIPDLVNKKLIMLTAITTQASDTSDQSAVTKVQLLVVGTR